MIGSFQDFLNEDLNLMIDVGSGDMSFSDRWFYYDKEDEIIYGCDEEPVNVTCLFYFNPKECVIIIDGQEVKYDINNPICLIEYHFKGNEVRIYTDDVEDRLDELGYKGQSLDRGDWIQKIFDKFDEDRKYLLMYGNKLIATTFDIIEEN